MLTFLFYTLKWGLNLRFCQRIWHQVVYGALPILSIIADRTDGDEEMLLSQCKLIIAFS
jgi:hypothetical protein